MKTKLGNYTRGGQILAHQARMFGQGVKVSLLVGLLASLLWMLFLIYMNGYDLYYYLLREWALLKIDFFSLISQNDVTLTYYNQYDHQFHKTYASMFIKERRPLYATLQVKHFLLSKFLWGSLGSFLAGIFLSILFFIHRGKKRYQKHIERGGKIVKWQELKNLLKKQRKASDLKIDTLPLVKDQETLHTLLVGSTGTGKTNLLYKLLPQIREKNQKALIVDLNGSFVKTHYDPKRDIILNPFDQRGSLWTPWADLKELSHYDAFAKAMIPGTFSTDTFWDKGAATILSEALLKLKAEGKESIHALTQILLASDLKTQEAFFKGTNAASLVSEASEKTTASILATLAPNIKALTLLEDVKDDSNKGPTVPFSMREWIQEEKEGWLFLTAAPDQRETLTPLISTWLDISLSSLMSLEPDHKRRVWFILDELPALQKVPSLKTFLSESRKYGGAIVAGVQNFAQLEAIYGRFDAEALLNQFRTLFVFNTSHPETCKDLSNMLGEQEIQETTENISYGANTHRDGVNLNTYQKRNPLVLPTQISTLHNLEAYIKLPGNLPITKLQMNLERPLEIAPAFLRKEIRPRVYSVPPSPKARKDTPKQKAKLPPKNKKTSNSSIF